MKGRTIIPLVLGLGIGIFAIKMFVDVLKKAQGAGGDTVSLVRARGDIAATLQITDAMIETAMVPKSVAPKQAISDPQEVIGRVSAQMIPQGMPIVSSMLSPKGTLAGMAARIPDGYRAVAVKVDEVVGVAGWVKPKSRVDVVAVMQINGSGRNETISRVILQNVEVLAVGQDIGNGGEDGAAMAKSVTLLVTPDAVPKLHLASTKGTIRLAMRNQNDGEGGQMASTTDNDLLDIAPASRPAPTSPLLVGLLSKQPKPAPAATDKAEEAPSMDPPTPTWAVEVWSGTRVERVQFDGEGDDARLVSYDRPGAGRVRPAVPPKAAANSPLRHASAPSN